MGRVRILLADDHTIVRQGLRQQRRQLLQVARMGGGTVKLLPGTFRFRNAVYLCSNLRIVGSGADTVIAKPFHFEVLIARIGREIERSRQLAKLRNDVAALDARVVGRAIELGEMRDRWLASEAELRRLQEKIRSAEA